MCLSCWSRTAKNSVEHSSVSTAPFFGENFETLDQSALAAGAMILGNVAERAASHTVWAEDTSDYTMHGFYLGAVSALRKQRSHHSAQVCPMDSPQMIQVSNRDSECGDGACPKEYTDSPWIGSQSRGVQDNTDELDRTLEGQDERRRADERRTSNVENEVEGELVRGDGHGENRLEVSTIEEDVWTPAEEHEDIQDDVAFVDGDRNKNYAAYEQKYSLDSVLALDANDAAPDDEVVKEAEAVIVEGEAVDLPGVDFDRKDEATSPRCCD